MRPALGDRVKDVITGYTGIVVAVTKWLNGRERFTIQSEQLQNGKSVDTESFDVNQIQLIKAGAFADEKETGGPRPEPRPTGK